MPNTNTLSSLVRRMEKMELLQCKRTDKNERSAVVKLAQKPKELKNNANLDSEKLLNTLLTDGVAPSDVLLLK